MKALKLRPFVPSGQDYFQAVQFYTDLGFEKIFSSETETIFKIGDVEFFLQNFQNEELQANYMMELCVQDLDGWWNHIQNTGVEEKYDIQINPPKDHPSGKRVIHLIDIAGVLWHITE